MLQGIAVQQLGTPSAGLHVVGRRCGPWRRAAACHVAGRMHEQGSCTTRLSGVAQPQVYRGLNDERPALRPLQPQTQQAQQELAVKEHGRQPHMHNVMVQPLAA